MGVMVQRGCPSTRPESKIPGPWNTVDCVQLIADSQHISRQRPALGGLIADEYC
jgi:hypothetical protein